MAASANPSGNQESSNQNNKNSSSLPSGNGVPANSANSGGTTENTASQTALKHNPGISSEWTPEEQSVMDELLIKWVSSSLCFFVIADLLAGFFVLGVVSLDFGISHTNSDVCVLLVLKVWFLRNSVLIDCVFDWEETLFKWEETNSSCWCTDGIHGAVMWPFAGMPQIQGFYVMPRLLCNWRTKLLGMLHFVVDGCLWVLPAVFVCLNLQFFLLLFMLIEASEIY